MAAWQQNDPLMKQPVSHPFLSINVIAAAALLCISGCSGGRDTGVGAAGSGGIALGSSDAGQDEGADTFRESDGAEAQGESADDGGACVGDGCLCEIGDTRPCWEGDEAARGVGACLDGVQTCQPVSEFTEWGACEDAVLPATEACEGNLDEDCDGEVDCDDDDCAEDPACACQPTDEICDNGADEDCDGDIDCADDDCAASSMCCTVAKTPDAAFALPDGVGVAYEGVLSFEGFAPEATIEAASDIRRVCMEIEHSWMHDLRFQLRCPSEVTVTLGEQNFISNEVYLGEPNPSDDVTLIGVGYEYCWDMAATNPPLVQFSIENDLDPLAVPFTMPAGSYRPENSFDAFLGCPLNGDWVLVITDEWGADNGYVFSARIEFDSALACVNE